MSSSIQCPRCQQTQTLQLVSSIYNSNTKEWVERGSHLDNFGARHSTSEFHEAHTLLGEMVAPPEKPSPPSNPRIWFIIQLILIIFVLSICSTICVSLLPILILPAAIFSEQPETLSDLTTRIDSFLATLPAWAGLAGIILVVVIGLTGLALIILLARLIKKRYDRDLGKYKKGMTIFEEVTMPNWELAMENWNKMYYCSFDNIVFIPDETDAMPVEEMKSFLGRYLRT